LYILTGANGAGKSSLLAVLSLLAPPSAGILNFAGQIVDWKWRQISGLRREVTLLHQSPYLSAGTVASNVAYGLELRKIRGAEQQRLVEEALVRVGLAGFGSRIARDLSGGEQRRVALARALAIKPRVLLLDEPFAGLDRKAAELLEEVVRSLSKTGITVILSTHDMCHSQHLGGEVIALEGGKLVPAHRNVIPEAFPAGLCCSMPLGMECMPDAVAGC
jgi:tungstate transport system ATP-binding protein